MIRGWVADSRRGIIQPQERVLLHGTQGAFSIWAWPWPGH